MVHSSWLIDERGQGCFSGLFPALPVRNTPAHFFQDLRPKTLPSARLKSTKNRTFARGGGRTASPDGGETQRREDSGGGHPVPEIPQHHGPVGAAHEAGVQHVPRHHPGENGHGGYPKALRNLGAAPQGLGERGKGDSGSGERGGQVTAL